MNKVIMKVLCVRCMCGEQWWMGDTPTILCDCGATLRNKEMDAIVPDNYDLESKPYKEPGFWDEEIEADLDSIEEE